MPGRVYTTWGCSFGLFIVGLRLVTTEKRERSLHRPSQNGPVVYIYNHKRSSSRSSDAFASFARRLVVRGGAVVVCQRRRVRWPHTSRARLFHQHSAQNKKTL